MWTVGRLVIGSLAGPKMYHSLLSGIRYLVVMPPAGVWVDWGYLWDSLGYRLG